MVCESEYDHKGNKKDLNFKILNKKFKDKIIYLVLDKPFNLNNSPWKNQGLQRDYILKKLDDYIFVTSGDLPLLDGNIVKQIVDTRLSSWRKKIS